MMTDWMALAGKLPGYDKSDGLVRSVIVTLEQLLKLHKSLLLVLDNDGRQLMPYDSQSSQQTGSWAVSDFAHPFSHVIQSAKVKYLSLTDTVYWEADKKFAQLTGSLGLNEGVLLIPVVGHKRQVYAVLMLTGSESILKPLCKSDDFQFYIRGFSKQWSLLSELEYKEKTHAFLTESLGEAEREVTEKKQAEALSKTLVGHSKVMILLRENIIKAAKSSLSVVLQGATGTGKEVSARAIHDFSCRKNGNFVAINCAAVPETLLESELFGYQKGAFSGADKDKKGLIAEANNGTLFLDEIGDMSISFQAKLLRVLESGTYRPVGGCKEEQSDFRLICASYVDLAEQVNAQKFRSDLYYRLLQYPVCLPALKEHIEDMALLVNHFIEQYNTASNTHIRGMHYCAMNMLKAYDFPGNVRELKHLVDFCCVNTESGQEIKSATVYERLNESAYAESDNTCCDPSGIECVNDLTAALNQYEAQIIRERFKRYPGDRQRVAESLSIPKRSLAYRCKKLEIDVQ